MNKVIKNLRNEEGFTLVELLVVIIIIGILAAIAIPVFLNQRKKANDASVEADVKNVATQIETALVDTPNATDIATTATTGTAAVTVGGASVSVPLSPDVTIQVGGAGDASTAASGTGTSNHYIITGSHVNGDNYLTGTSYLVYDNAAGGLQ